MKDIRFLESFFVCQPLASRLLHVLDPVHFADGRFEQLHQSFGGAIAIVRVGVEARLHVNLADDQIGRQG